MLDNKSKNLFVLLLIQFLSYLSYWLIFFRGKSSLNAFFGFGGFLGSNLGLILLIATAGWLFYLIINHFRNRLSFLFILAIVVFLNFLFSLYYRNIDVESPYYNYILMSGGMLAFSLVSCLNGLALKKGLEIMKNKSDWKAVCKFVLLTSLWPIIVGLCFYFFSIVFMFGECMVPGSHCSF